MMDRDRFIQAKEFIFSDMEREINLAKSGQGAGNFMCALSLLCYTEFMGGVRRNVFKQGEAKNNFNAFLQELGNGYSSLPLNAYSIFRCGLAHEYFVKEDCTIYMLGDKKPALGKDGDRYYFVVEQYYADFKAAVLALETELFVE